MEFDLLRYWQVDLPRDLGTSRLSWRRLGVFVQHMPPDSATMRHLHGQIAAWRVGDYLLANVIDLLAGANWQRASKGQRPKPFGRPESLEVIRQRRERQRSEMERIARKHDEWKQRKAVSGGSN